MVERHRAKVWIADDDEAIRFVLAEALREAGVEVRAFADADSLRAALARATPEVIVSDIRMPGSNGLEFLAELRAAGSQVPVIVMSAFTDVASTAAAYRNGAFDYLPKPFDLDEAIASVQRALGESRQTVAAPAKAEEVEETELIGTSPAMREVFRAIGRVAASDLNVLITGPTGTGKELVARALHRHSARASRPFVALNTAAIPAELLESELFGHEAGAFTGAVKRNAGRFEQAEGGTLFLDEIGDMPLSLQTRLLRVLAENEFYRVGGRELIRADVRVVAATHQDLEGKVERGEFRADLLHRLDVVRLRLPPLDERAADIPLLAAHFLARAAQEMKLEAKRFTPSALVELSRRRWPGNVRQLENLCRRLAVMTPGREIRPQDLPAGDDAIAVQVSEGWRENLHRLARNRLAGGEQGIYDELRREFDATLIDAALAENAGRRVRAAEQLGLGRNTLTRKVGASRRRGKK
ncbi:MAG: nitrogen regulation protein NR(I) [Proteobacteria bacterium]|uniref:nitrogen regulation protein NR(I) n=1 Tax=Rudaea sp. TaxID=2136325 RepID=UPI003785224D|nr:nitrogen regulation protein NR(I) [Pseudomonadota bacterium]